MNLMGGRGECSFCHQWYNNVSYHSAQECVANPGSTLNRLLAEEKSAPKSTERTGLQLSCDCCQKPITKPAALVFSPPRDSAVGLSYDQGLYTKKSHLCHACYELVCDVTGIDNAFPRTPIV